MENYLTVNNNDESTLCHLFIGHSGFIKVKDESLTNVKIYVNFVIFPSQTSPGATGRTHECIECNFGIMKILENLNHAPY